MAEQIKSSNLTFNEMVGWTIQNLEICGVP